MPPRLVSDDALVERLTALLRDRGFDAASLGDIATATGLQKSSLYHRFPGGKQQMASEVAAAVRQHFAAEILAPLGGEGTPRARLERVARNLDQFYGGGRRGCILETLSVGSAGPETAAALREAAAAWVSAFAAVARQAGATRAESIERAEDAVAAIEGALVLARVSGDTRAFRRALANLPGMLLGE